MLSEHYDYSPFFTLKAPRGPAVIKACQALLRTGAEGDHVGQKRHLLRGLSTNCQVACRASGIVCSSVCAGLPTGLLAYPRTVFACSHTKKLSYADIFY